MKKLFWAALILPFLVWASSGMQQSQVPPKFSIPWGNSAGSAYLRSIPIPSQIGIQNCAASLTDGFPPLTFVPGSAGGCPPFGADFNGVLKQATQWSQWQAAGAAPLYDASFSASIGGYPSGAVLANVSTAGCFWISTVDNNASNPDAAGAGWSSNCPGGGVASTSTGAANAQVIAATPFVRSVGATVNFVAGFSNTGPLQVNINGAGLVNVFRRSQLGATNSVGGEVGSGQAVTIQWDGTRWQCASCGLVLVGQVVDFVAGVAPAAGGWLVADGSCVSQSTYSDLFSVAGTSYGSCSAGLFALPDLRGRMTAGYDTQGTQGAASRLTSAGSGCAATTVGVGCGNQNQTLDVTQIPSHTHSGTTGTESQGHTHTTGITSASASGGSASFFQGGSGTGTEFWTSGGESQTHTHAFTTGGTGGGLAHPILSPVQTVTKMIKI